MVGWGHSATECFANGGDGPLSRLLIRIGMTKTSWVVALSLMASPVIAQEPVTLWQDLKVGMTKAEVAALYPTGKVSLTPQCEAKVSGDYRKGLLVGVVLKFGDLMGASQQAWNQGLECQSIVRASIVSRYGQPAEVGRRVFQGKETGDQMFWLNGPVTIEFYAQDRRPFTVVQYSYTPPPTPVPPSAAGKL